MDLIVPSGTEQNNLKQTKMDNLKVAVIPTETDNELTPNDPIEKILAHKEVVVYSLELYFHKQNEMELPMHYSVLFNMDFVSDQGKQGKPIAELSPQERKEAFIVELMARIEGKLTDRLTTQFTTCSCAPAFGWSVDEYNYMPTVARRLREKGYTVSSSVNHEVTDWLISV